METREEKTNNIENLGMERADDELDTVAGGDNHGHLSYTVICRPCGRICPWYSTRSQAQKHYEEHMEYKGHRCSIVAEYL